MSFFEAFLFLSVNQRSFDNVKSELLIIKYHLWLNGYFFCPHDDDQNNTKITDDSDPKKLEFFSCEDLNVYLTN